MSVRAVISTRTPRLPVGVQGKRILAAAEIRTPLGTYVAWGVVVDTDNGPDVLWWDRNAMPPCWVLTPLGGTIGGGSE